MRIRHRGFEPEVDPSAWVAPTATLVGNVFVGPRARIMYGAVLNAEGSRIEIGECAIVGENSVIRATDAGNEDHPVRVGDHVFVGPHATLLGCQLEPSVYIATGATVLQGGVVHSGAVVAVGALVHTGTVVPRGFFVPPNTIALGDPAVIYSPDEKVTLTSAIKAIRFGSSGFGGDPAEDRLAAIRQATEFRSADYERHFEDTVTKKKKGSSG